MIYSKKKNYNSSLFEFSQLLFAAMGSVIIFSSIVIYFIGNRYIREPEIVALVVIIMNIFFLIIAFIVLKSFEKIAEASKIKSEFLSAISHQLRSPIINLKWTLGVMTEEEKPKRKKEYILNLVNNVSRISELVESFLIASEIGEEGFPFKKEPIDLKKITEDAIYRSKIFAEKSGIKILFKPLSDIPIIFSDESRIKLVVENLLTNAIDYSKKEGIIEISIKNEDKKVYFSIKDFGIGIPNKSKKSIFQKFFRANNSEKKKKKGIGLGLFITKSIIEKAGGEIWFESEEGKGTIFSFYIPLNEK